MIPNTTLIKFEDLNIMDQVLIMPNLTFQCHTKSTVLLGPYAKLRKAAVSPFLSAWNNSAPTRWIVVKIFI